MTPIGYRYARQRLGRSHDEMTFVGISRRSSYRYENGEQSVPAATAMLLELLTAHPQDVVQKRDRMRTGY